MAAIDDELMKAAEEDAQEVAFILNELPQDLKDKFTEDDIYYFIDIMLASRYAERPHSRLYQCIRLCRLVHPRSIQA